MLSGICISVHPLIYFFTFLYYTDVGSLLFAMISLTCHVHQHRFYSALFSLISLTFRQTNIIIVAYEIGWSLINEMEEKSKKSEICRIYASQSTENTKFSDYFLVLWKNARKEFNLIFSILRSCLWKCRYQIIVIFLFLLFFIWNNHSITLGHQEHHQMVFHLAQLNYFSVYSAFFLAAHLVSLMKPLNWAEEQKKRELILNTFSRMTMKFLLNFENNLLKGTRVNFILHGISLGNIIEFRSWTRNLLN